MKSFFSLTRKPIAKSVQSEELLRYLKELKTKIFSNWSSSPFVSPVESQISYVTQNDTKIQIITVKEKKIQKEININKDKFNDPFAPPYSPGFLIEQDFNDYHCIIYNKYPLFPYHLVIFTSEFVSQYTHLVFKGKSSKQTSSPL